MKEKINQTTAHLFNLDGSKEKSIPALFKLEKIKSGKKPSIITIDGYLSDKKYNDDDFLGWKLAIMKKYPDNEWYHLSWKSSNIIELGIEFFTGIRRTQLMALSAKFMAAAVLPTTILLRSGIGRIIVHWRRALKESERTGNELAHQIRIKGLKNSILMGHSLGCRVIYNCLKNLSDLNQNDIKEVHLLGGAVESEQLNWKTAGKSVQTKVFNYYSLNDSILRWPYKAGTFDIRPIGRTKIKSKSVTNINVSKQVKGHTKFKDEFRKFIQSS